MFAIVRTAICGHSLALNRIQATMELITELRARLRTVVGPLIGTFLVIYFIFHLMHGDRGLMAWWQVSDGITASRAVLADLDEKKEALENRVHLLRSGSLDLDLLDERARHVLNVGHDDEIIIFPDAEYAPVKLP
jgi:cell division protein FtsB